MPESPSTGSNDGGIAPVIVTAQFDPPSFALFTRLRDRHFPPALNKVPAHLTLFHHLPGERLRAIGACVAELCAAHGPLRFDVTATRFLGRGVALEVTCPPLIALRAAIAARMDASLTPQDRQGFKPHVTVQNKVPPEAARALRPVIEALLPLSGAIEGLRLWHYRGGPWQDAGRFPFTGQEMAPP